jgi:hypothetical protein
LNTKIARTLLIAGAAVPAALSLAGCAGSLSAATVESGIKTHLASAAPAPIKSASCKDLDAKVGASENCTVSLVNGHRYQVAVRVDKVNSGTAHYHIQVVKQLS